MDLQKAIRISVETGKTGMGSRQGKNLALKGGAKLLLIAGNCPKRIKEEVVYAAEKSKVPCYEASFTSMEIGSICGKPFPVSVLSIIDPGNSDIMMVLEKGTVIEAGAAEVKETKASMKKRSKEKKGEKEAKKSEGEKSGGNEGENSEAEQ